MNILRDKSKLLCSAVVCALTAATGPVAAANHALLLTLDYAGTRNELPGIAFDGRYAREIAQAMGVPDRNIVHLKNRDLDFRGLSGAVRGLAERIAEGDKVFVYYSGHGYQSEAGDAGNRCSESLVAADNRLYFDAKLESDLEYLAGKASQVVMLNDSCYSGGTAAKSIDAGDERVPKFFSGEVTPARANASGYRCGHAVNKVARNLEIVGAKKATQILYVGASADNEVAAATRKGSAATIAWHYCIGRSLADSNRSGGIDGEELRQCAQSVLNELGARQTITLVGNAALPIISPATSAGDTVAIDASRALGDIRAGADPNIGVRLDLASSALKVGRDQLDFTISSEHAGYLYILHVGSDGKTFNLLFPNRYDRENRIEAGQHRFPRASWRVRAGGPAGDSYLLAVVAPVARNFDKFMDTSGVFASAPTDSKQARNLLVEATGASNAGGGRYGASQVIHVREEN